jgi:hypothetical protein
VPDEADAVGASPAHVWENWLLASEGMCTNAGTLPTPSGFLAMESPSMPDRLELVQTCHAHLQLVQSVPNRRLRLLVAMPLVLELQARQDIRIQYCGIIGGSVLAVRRRLRAEQSLENPNALCIALRRCGRRRGAAGCHECARYRDKNPEPLLQNCHFGFPLPVEPIEPPPPLNFDYAGKSDGIGEPSVAF